MNVYQLYSELNLQIKSPLARDEEKTKAVRESFDKAISTFTDTIIATIASECGLDPAMIEIYVEPTNR